MIAQFSACFGLSFLSGPLAVGNVSKSNNRMTQDDGNADQNDRACDTGWFFSLGARAQMDLARAGEAVGRKRLEWKRRLDGGRLEAWL